MITNEVLGIVFANVHDETMGELTKKRAIASIPFGARYRLIDFSLSNLVNAGISKVGVITKSNYQSLMDHIGSGKYWDLDRKKSGLFILPPYNTVESGYTSSKVDALGGIMTFLIRSTEKYVVMCDANVVSNIDIDAVIDYHKETKADVTFVYKNDVMPKNPGDIMSFNLDKNGRIKSIRLDEGGTENCNFCLDITVIGRELLIDLIKEALAQNLKQLNNDVFMPKVNDLKFYGYEVTDYACVIDCTDTYVKANLDLLNHDVRSQLFCPDRPIYTKNRDNMPAKYGINAKVTNSLVGDGSVLKGTVKNSIIFRDVTIEDDVTLDHCIIMQGCVIGKNSTLKYVAVDKNSEISENSNICGTQSYTVIIPKETKV